MPVFTDEEISVLKLFYARRPARQIRADTGVDLWPLVNKHRAPPSEQYEVVAQLVSLRPGRPVHHPSVSFGA